MSSWSKSIRHEATEKPVFLKPNVKVKDKQTQANIVRPVAAV